MSLTNLTETLNCAADARCECPSSTNATTRSRSAIGCGLPISCPHICHADREPQIKQCGNRESDWAQPALVGFRRCRVRIPGSSGHPFRKYPATHSDFDRFFDELLSALGFAANATLPSWWQGWPARLHVRRWIDDLGLSEDRIIDVATETRSDHPNPPDGPKALDRFMERAAQRDAQAAADASGGKAKRSRKAQGKPTASPDELAAFYAAKVNSDEFLPPSMISNAICEAMLARKLVTTDRLRQRGIL